MLRRLLSNRIIFHKIDRDHAEVYLDEVSEDTKLTTTDVNSIGAWFVSNEMVNFVFCAENQCDANLLESAKVQGPLGSDNEDDPESMPMYERLNAYQIIAAIKVGIIESEDQFMELEKKYNEKNNTPS